MPLAIFQVRVGEEVTHRRVLAGARGDFQNCLRGDAFMNVQRNRIDGEAGEFTFAGPFEPTARAP